MKKIYWGVFVIVAFGVAAGLLYIINKPTPVVAPVVVKPVVQKQSTTTPSSVATSSVVDMTGWKTYNNSQFDFSFSYPNTLSVSIAPDGAVEIIRPEDKNADGPVSEILIHVNANPDNLSVNAWSESNIPYFKDLTISNVMIGGVSAVEVDGSEGVLDNHIVASKGNNIFDFDIMEGLPGEDQIFSSFQFTQPQASTTSTAGWQTYNDTKYGFSFEYPAGWNVSTDSNGVVDLDLPGDDEGDNGISVAVLTEQDVKDLNQGVTVTSQYNQTYNNNSWQITTSTDSVGEKFFDALLQNGNNYISVGSFDASDLTAVRDQLLSSLKFTN